MQRVFFSFLKNCNKNIRLLSAVSLPSALRVDLVILFLAFFFLFVKKYMMKFNSTNFPGC